MVRCKHHSCICYQNSRLYFAHRPFPPYPVQLPRGSFAKESKQNGTAAEAFCVRAAAVLISRRLNGAAAEFPRARWTRRSLGAALTAAPAPARPRAALTAPAAAAQPALLRFPGTQQLLTDPQICYLRISVSLHLWATSCAVL